MTTGNTFVNTPITFMRVYKMFNKFYFYTYEKQEMNKTFTF